MRLKISHLFTGVALGAVVCAGPAVAGGEAGRLVLRDLGSKFVGFTTEKADNGSVNVINAMFVQYILPADRKHEYPIVMIHGGGGQGTDWMETPDGRDGWDVYVVDRPGHGRSQSNPSCGNGMVGTANSQLISRLSTSDPKVWPGGAPTPTNDAVVAWTASSATAPYCGDAVAAEKISALLDEIGPAILLAHSAGGGATFRVPDLNAKNVVGIIAFEAAGANPVAPGFGSGPAPITSWVTKPALPKSFKAVDKGGCPMQGENPSELVNFAGKPVVLVASEMGLTSQEALKCEAAVWRQAGVDATAVYLPDRGVRGGGHFSMAQLDNAKSAQVFIDLATEIETSK
jgi:pimeloyl-ACP methyl ester carboxylesterase